MMCNVQALGVGVIYTAQERMQAVENTAEEDEEAEESDIMFVPDVSKGARSAINAMVPAIGRLYTVRVTKPVKLRTGGTKDQAVARRRLCRGVHRSYDTGTGSDYEQTSTPMGCERVGTSVWIGGLA